MFSWNSSGQTPLQSASGINKVNLKRHLGDPTQSNWLERFENESVNKVARLEDKTDTGDPIEQHRKKMASIPAVAEDDEMDFPRSFTRRGSSDWPITTAEKNSLFTRGDSFDRGEAMSVDVGKDALQKQPSTSSKDVEAEITAAIEAFKLFQDSLPRESPLRHVSGPLVVLPTIPEATEYSADNCMQMDSNSQGFPVGEASQYTAPITVWESQFRQKSGLNSLQEPLRGGLRRITRNFEALNVISDQDNCIL